MPETSALDAFYGLLNELEERIGGKRLLGACDGRMFWPERGVYFFFEPGETRRNDPARLRVVRVGTHALKARSKTTLWKRLSQHRGTLVPRGGNHRGSIFRLLVGEALGKRHPGLIPPDWGVGSSASPEVRNAERDFEVRVSDYLGEMSLLFVAVPDEPGPQSMRGFIERNAIALLSCCRRASEGKPNSDWLGQGSNREPVRRSGLWNNRHVWENHDPDFLSVFADFVRTT